MKTTYKIPHVESVEVPRDFVMRLTFDHGITRELEFLAGSNQGTVFAFFDDRLYFAQVKVVSESRTVAWTNGFDLDPAVLHGDFDPAGRNHFRVLSSGTDRRAARSE
jgi:hypothetical protein